MLGLSGIHKSLQKFIKNLKSEQYLELGRKRTEDDSLVGPFFMVKVDFKSCFDSIPHEKLLSIFENGILKEDSYLIYKYAELDLLTSKKRFHKGCCRVHEMPQFSHLIGEISGAKKCASKKKTSKSMMISSKIYVDQVVYSIESRAELLKLLRKHVTQHFVKVDGRHIYRQKIGIPQGSILSSLLCR